MYLIEVVFNLTCVSVFAALRFNATEKDDQNDFLKTATKQWKISESVNERKNPFIYWVLFTGQIWTVPSSLNCNEEKNNIGFIL